MKHIIVNDIIKTLLKIKNILSYTRQGVILFDYPDQH
jgi:hypothetical protein